MADTQNEMETMLEFDPNEFGRRAEEVFELIKKQSAGDMNQAVHFIAFFAAFFVRMTVPDRDQDKGTEYLIGLIQSMHKFIQEHLKLLTTH